MKQKSKVKWFKYGPDIWKPNDAGHILDSIPNGIYIPSYHNDYGTYLQQTTLETDELLTLPSSIHEKVLNIIDRFIKSKELYKQYGFLYKRGILLHSKPGNGKSCLINIICNKIESQKDVLIIPINNIDQFEFFTLLINKIREAEPNKLLLVIMEDIDVLANSHKESTLLNTLDGINNIDNIIYLATTNYIEHLKARIINRPSRFDDRIYIDSLNKLDREYILTKKVDKDILKNYDIENILNKTEDYNFSYFIEFIKSVFILGYSIEETCEKLSIMKDFKKESSNNYEKENNSTIGFKIYSSNSPLHKGLK